MTGTSPPPAKPKHPAAKARAVAKDLCEALGRCCEVNGREGRPYLVVAGSLRRRRPLVGDIEILCVPRIGTVREEGGLFTKQGSLVDMMLDLLIGTGAIAKRLNVNGHETWGAKNKLAVHVASGIPIDFFLTTERAWYNYLVCRTGGKDNNTRIATAAQARGLKWHSTDEGFEVVNARTASTILNRELRPGQLLTVSCEEDVYNLAGLEFLRPEERT